MITTIGKKIHTLNLVKENTPCCHKIRQECGFTKKGAFFYILLCFLPHSCANSGKEVRLMLPNTYQEIYDTHTCLNFSNIISKHWSDPTPSRVTDFVPQFL